MTHPSLIPLLTSLPSARSQHPKLSFISLVILVLFFTPSTISHPIHVEEIGGKSSSASTSFTPTVSRSAQAFIAPSPLLYEINQKQTECIYSFFSKNDSVTFSVFVVEAFMRGNPAAKVVFEGPVAGLLEDEGGLKTAGIKTKLWNGNENSGDLHGSGDGNGDSANSGKDVDEGEAKNKINKHSKYYQNNANALGRRIQTSLKNHWPTLQSHDKLQRFDKRIGVIHRTLKIDWTHAGESEDKVAAREEVKEREAQTFDERSKSGNINNSDRNNIDNHIQTITQEKIQPYQETRSIKLSGYYRLCTTADYHPLLVEMDMRSKSELGGLDSQTGHVYEWTAKERMEQDSLIDGVMDDDDVDIDHSKNAKNAQDVEILQSQIEDQDLHATKSQLKQLNQIVSEMKTSLKESVYRIKSHEAEAKRNYDGMVWSGKVETFLYLAVTGLQVYTVRRWLLTNSVLGR